MLVEEAGAAHDLRGHEGRGHHRHEAVGERLVQRHRHDGQLEAGADALEVVEAGARDLRAALGVDRVQALTQGEVILGLEALGREVAGGGALVAQNHEVLLAADGHAVENEVRQEAREAVGLGVGGVGGGLGGLHLLGELLGLSQDRRTLLLGGAAHGLGDLFLGGSQRLESLQGLAAGGVGRDDLIDEAGVRSAGTLGGAGGFGVFTQGTHINHASHPMPGGRAVSPTDPTLNSIQQVKVLHKLHPGDLQNPESYPPLVHNRVDNMTASTRQLVSGDTKCNKKPLHNPSTGIKRDTLGIWTQFTGHSLPPPEPEPSESRVWQPPSPAGIAAARPSTSPHRWTTRRADGHVPGSS